MTDSEKRRVATSQLTSEILEIVRDARAGYGQEIVHTVAHRLTVEFGRGFSEANVWNFRQFYLTYPSEEILYTLRRELSWSHHRLIMWVENGQLCKAPLHN